MSFTIFTDIKENKEILRTYNKEVKESLEKFFEESISFRSAQYNTYFQCPTQRIKIVNRGGRNLAYCQMTTLMEQCSTVVFSNVYFSNTNEELALATLNYFEEIAKILGFGTILTTASENQLRQLKYFPKAGYEMVNEAENPRTGNTVYTFIKNIKKKEE